MDSRFHGNDRHLPYIVIPAKAGIQEPLPELIEKLPSVEKNPGRPSGPPGSLAPKSGYITPPFSLDPRQDKEGYGGDDKIDHEDDH